MAAVSPAACSSFASPGVSPSCGVTVSSTQVPLIQLTSDEPVAPWPSARSRTALPPLTTGTRAREGPDRDVALVRTRGCRPSDHEHRQRIRGLRVGKDAHLAWTCFAQFAPYAEPATGLTVPQLVTP